MNADRLRLGVVLAAILTVSVWTIRSSAIEQQAATPGPIVMSATGGGKAYVTNPPLAIGTAEFSFSAVQHEDGTASGFFRMVRQRAGFNVDFTGRVTCMAVDPVTHRAWIGGVVVSNNSDDPNHTTPIHQPGEDVWFRVVDNGEGEDAPPDRSSVYGFAGAAGVTTSAEYCALKLWPAGDANAFALTEGNIQVLSR